MIYDVEISTALIRKSPPNKTETELTDGPQDLEETDDIKRVFVPKVFGKGLICQDTCHFTSPDDRVHDRLPLCTKDSFAMFQFTK